MNKHFSLPVFGCYTIKDKNNNELSDPDSGKIYVFSNRATAEAFVEAAGITDMVFFVLNEHVFLYGEEFILVAPGKENYEKVTSASYEFIVDCINKRLAKVEE
jgi:hypothetical protein